MKRQINKDVWKSRMLSAGVALLRTVLLVGFSYIILHPIILMISKSFMAQEDVFDSSVLWIPKHFTLQNLRTTYITMKYALALKNSIWYSLLGTIMQVIPCMMAGYAFARYQFKGSKFLFAVVILTILMPPQQFMTPLYLHLSRFDIFGIVKALNNGKTINLAATKLPYYLLSLTGFGLRNGLFIFMFRQSFRGIPRETEEAAVVDGAGQFRIFWQIMLPSSVTILVTVMLFSFVWQYNDTYYSNLFLSDVRTLPRAYSLFDSALMGWDGSIETNSILAQYVLEDPKVLGLLRNSGMLMILAPLLIVYSFAQKYFIQSIERSGLVG
ncbi:MAG: carbohydrate ABC transporter permease [Oscillospiraceae bacterium]|nr:carbohydrate ABC transporter permease [Oscillospiraceae bacterium]